MNNLIRRKVLRTSICGLLFGVFVTPMLVNAQVPDPPPDPTPLCIDDVNPCTEGSVWIGNGCSTGCGFSTDQACCAYNLWKCVGNSTTYYSRTCNSVAKIYCSWVNGGWECFIVKLDKPVDPPQ